MSKPAAKLVRFPPEIAKRIDDYRWGNRIGSESEAIRRIIVAGLDALEASARKDGGA